MALDKAQIALLKKEYQRAERECLKLKEIHENNNNKEGIKQTDELLLNIYLFSNEFEKIIPILNRMEEDNNNQKDMETKIDKIIFFGEVYYEMKQFEKVNEYMNKAENEIESVKQKEMKKEGKKDEYSEMMKKIYNMKFLVGIELNQETKEIEEKLHQLIKQSQEQYYMKSAFIQTTEVNYYSSTNNHETSVMSSFMIRNRKRNEVGKNVSIQVIIKKNNEIISIGEEVKVKYIEKEMKYINTNINKLVSGEIYQMEVILKNDEKEISKHIQFLLIK